MVEEAEIRHKDYVDLGQTSYYPKVLSGAFVEDIYYVLPWIWLTTISIN